MMSALGTEDNGYLHRFFALLNHSKDAFETSSVQVQIPETIVLNMGIIVAWFFTSKKDGSVRRKKRVNTTKENVAAMLHANLKKNLKSLGLSNAAVPAATVTYNATDADGLKIQNVRHLMENEVDEFLRNTPIKNCLLQQWIHPCGNQNSVLHCLWTSCGVQISRRNARNLFDDRAPAACRLATYESGAILPANMSLCTSTTKLIIKNACNHIAEHLSTIAAAPSSMTTYWKISSDLRVVLLWCSQFNKVGERKKWHAGPSVSPTIQLSYPQTETQISLPICPFCKNIAGIEESSMHRNSDTTSQHAPLPLSIFGDGGIKSISFGTILDFCLNRGAIVHQASSTVAKNSDHQWRVIPQEFRSLKLGYNLKQFNSESLKSEFRQKSVSVCEKCFSKYTLCESDIRNCEMQSKAHDFGNPAFAILPPTFCSSYTVEAYEKHFERLRGSDTTNPKIKTAIKELSRIWDDDTHGIQHANRFIHTKITESFGKPSPSLAYAKSQLLGVVDENDDSTFSSEYQYDSKIFSNDGNIYAKQVAVQASKTSSRPDEAILKTLPEKSAWLQSASSSFNYNLLDSVPDLRSMFNNACTSCKRTTNEQRMRGLSLSMSEWLNFCKSIDVCTLMPLKTSNCIAAFIHANKWSSDPDENQMNLDEFGSAIIFLAAKAHVLVIDDSQVIPSGKSCSGVVLAGVKRFLAGIGVHEGPTKPQTTMFGLESKHLNAKNYADVAELDSMFDDSYYDEDTTTFELWQAIPTIPRMFERVAASDSSALANMGSRSTSVSMQEWMKFCDDLGVVKNLPLKRSDCVAAFVDAVNGKKSSAAHQEMSIEHFSQGLIHLAVESGIWGDISASKPSASACSGQIIRGIVLMLKELLCGTSLAIHDSSGIPDDPLQKHAMSRLSKASKFNDTVNASTRPTHSVVITAPLWQDIPMVVPLFNKVGQLTSSGFGRVSKRSKTVSMPEWMQMCEECRLTKLLPISRTDCISAFLYSNKSIVSDNDMHELDLIEFCQSLIFLAAKSGILGNVDLSSLPSAGSCNDEVSRGVSLLLKEARLDKYVGITLSPMDYSSSGSSNQKGATLHHNDDNQIPGHAHKLSSHDFAIAEDSNDEDRYIDNDPDDGSIDDADDGQVLDENVGDEDASDTPHYRYQDSDTCKKSSSHQEEVIIDDDEGENASCDTSCQSSSSDGDLPFDPTFKGRQSNETAPIWITEPSIGSLFCRISGGSERLSMQKLLQFCRSCNFLRSLKLSSTQFMGVFAKTNLGFDSNEHSNSDSLTLNEFCQGLIVILCKKISGSSRSGTNFPSARSCPKTVARSVIDLMQRSNMLTAEDFSHSRSNYDVVVPKLQIPSNISTWLSSESAARHRLKISPLFSSQYDKAPKPKTITDLYAGASSGETSRLLRRHQVTVGSQSARSVPIPPMQAKTESHGARSARFVRKN